MDHATNTRSIFGNYFLYIQSHPEKPFSNLERTDDVLLPKWQYYSLISCHTTWNKWVSQFNENVPLKVKKLPISNSYNIQQKFQILDIRLWNQYLFEYLNSYFNTTIAEKYEIWENLSEYIWWTINSLIQ